MNLLAHDEISIIGKWVMLKGKLSADSNCDRIEWLLNSVLIETAINGDGWETLYQDPSDDRYWVLTYPQSEVHGGGAPSLVYITESHAKDRFNQINTT